MGAAEGPPRLAMRLLDRLFVGARTALRGPRGLPSCPATARRSPARIEVARRGREVHLDRRFAASPLAPLGTTGRNSPRAGDLNVPRLSRRPTSGRRDRDRPCRPRGACWSDTCDRLVRPGWARCRCDRRVGTSNARDRDVENLRERRTICWPFGLSVASPRSKVKSALKRSMPRSALNGQLVGYARCQASTSRAERPSGAVRS